jgi:CubicO group peptidase (beta-lactamase class C family)
MKNSYINVPNAKMVIYALGYAKKDEPVTVTKGVLSSEACGVKTTASDMIRFVQANMSLTKLVAKLQRSITETLIHQQRTGRRPVLKAAVVAAVDLHRFTETRAPGVVAGRSSAGAVCVASTGRRLSSGVARFPTPTGCRGIFVVSRRPASDQNPDRTHG